MKLKNVWLFTYYNSVNHLAYASMIVSGTDSCYCKQSPEFFHTEMPLITKRFKIDWAGHENKCMGLVGNLVSYVTG